MNYMVRREAPKHNYYCVSRQQLGLRLDHVRVRQDDPAQPLSV